MLHIKKMLIIAKKFGVARIRFLKYLYFKKLIMGGGFAQDEFNGFWKVEKKVESWGEMTTIGGNIEGIRGARFHGLYRTHG